MNYNPLYIRVPVPFFKERQYVARVIFSEFIGLSYEIAQDNALRNTCIIRTGDKELEISDHFFSWTNESAGYLNHDRIPQNISFVKNEFLVEEDIPLLFGTGRIEKTENKIFCGIDVFASVFFMLSRWEECVLTERDYLERFPAQSSLAFKFNFLHRPVVNEWIGMLKNMLRYLVPEIAFKPKQAFEIIFTHDIDLLNAPVSLKEFAKDILKRKSLSALMKRIGYLFRGINPYDVFDYFMDVSEKHNTISRFYFMTGHNVPGRDGESYNNTRFYRKILKHIQSRGHTVGFHPSLLSYNNENMFTTEKLRLEKDLEAKVIEGRQHALRFDLPATWNIWETNGMNIDSTLGYSAKEGFRCGTGNTFSVFDVKNRIPLHLKEMPLIIMDTTLNVNRKLSILESSDIIRQYINIGRKYDMPITLLFHNLIDDSIDWKGWKDLYDNLFFNPTDL